MLSLRALDHEYVGDGTSWTAVARRLLEDRYIGAKDARRVRWLDTLGQLIGNTDRHLGNVSYFVEGRGRFRLAPVHDMLPMVFSPEGVHLVGRRSQPAPPRQPPRGAWMDVAWVRIGEPERRDTPGTTDGLGVFTQGRAQGGATARCGSSTRRSSTCACSTSRPRRRSSTTPTTSP